jgi:nucleotide-binding universal stress UspA family protein
LIANPRYLKIVLQRKPMQKILVATDNSEAAGNAIDYAVGLANQFGSLLTLVSAVDEPYSSGAGSLASLKEHMREEAREVMEEVADRIRPKLMDGAQVEVRTIDGDPDVVLPRIALAKDYELIVMGTKGSNTAKEFFTGSVANATLEKSTVPLLIIPQAANYAPPKKILLAADDKSIRPELVEPLVMMAEAFGAEIIVFHEANKRGETTYDENLENYLMSVPYRLQISIGDGSIGEGIGRAMESQGADVLAMVFRNHGFFAKLLNRSTVSDFVFTSDAPLLVLPDQQR